MWHLHTLLRQRSIMVDWTHVQGGVTAKTWGYETGHHIPPPIEMLEGLHSVHSPPSTPIEKADKCLCVQLLRQSSAEVQQSRRAYWTVRRRRLSDSTQPCAVRRSRPALCRWQREHEVCYNTTSFSNLYVPFISRSFVIAAGS